MRKRWMTYRASESSWRNGAAPQGHEIWGALWRDHAQTGATAPPAAASSPDPMDVAREREEEAVSLAVLQRRHELDTAVTEVLQSMATGQYGRCIECGQHIAVARLRAMPLAVRCLACQERFERAGRITAARESRYEKQEVML